MRKAEIIMKTSVIILILISIGMSVPQTKKLKLEHGDTLITSIRFTPDGKKFASASFNGTIVMWNAKSGERVWHLDLDGESRTKDRRTISHVIDLDVSSDGTTIAVSYNQSSVIGGTDQADEVHRIALIDAKNGQVIKTLIGHTFLMGGVAFSPDGESLLSVSGDQTARLWSVKTGQEILQIKLKAKGGLPAFSPDGKLFVIATTPIWGTPPQPIVGLYDAQSGRLLREFPRLKNTVMSLVFSPNGQNLAIASGDLSGSQIELWELTAQEPTRILTDYEKGITSIAFSPDGRLLASGELRNGRGIVVVRDLMANGQPRTHKVNAGVRALDFSPDATRLAVGTDKGQINVMSPDSAR